MVGWWDLFIAVAYFAIPLELVYCFLWYPFPIRAGPAVIVILFVSFITLCGGTHLVRCGQERVCCNFVACLPASDGQLHRFCLQ